MINIGGLTRCTGIDYPGDLSAVVFCQGCPWRIIPWTELISFLARRKGLLDGVVFSGGEPTMQPGILEAVCTVKAMGFKVGIHTAGPYPEVLESLLPYLDWIGMDLKAPFEDYELITGIPDSGRAARISADMVINSGIAHQFRTTVHPLLNEEGRLERLRHMVETEWGNSLVEQRCNAIDTLVSKFTTGECNGRSWIDG